MNRRPFRGKLCPLLLTFTLAVDVLICIGFILLWMRSYKVIDRTGVMWCGGYSIESWQYVEIYADSSSGRIVFGTDTGPPIDPDTLYIVEEPVTPMRATEPNFYLWRWNSLSDYSKRTWLDKPDSFWHRFGFAHNNSGFLPGYARWYIFRLIFPHWFAVLVTGTWPALWLKRKLFGTRKECRRRRLGLCVRCGYDLRSSPERCPECGSQAKGHERPAQHAS